MTAVVAVASGQSRLQHDIESDFAAAPGVLQEQLNATFASFEADIAVWAQDTRYPSWLGRASTADGQPSDESLEAAHAGLGGSPVATWTEFRVTNDAGTLLLDARRDAFGDDLSNDPLVKRALAGVPSLRLHGNLLEMAGPVMVEGAVRGVLIAGTPAEMVRANAARILHPSRVTLSESREGDSVVRKVDRDGETWLTTTVAIPGLVPGEIIGWATLSRSLTAELAPQRAALLRAVFLTAGIGFAIAMVMSIFLAHGLSSPVSRLTVAARKIGGGDYDHRVQVGGGELGLLGNAFNEMAAGLKQRFFFESVVRRYLAAPVVDQLVADPSMLRLGGERREVTVLFFDVAGFTSLAEELSAEDLVALVNGYLDTLMEAIDRHHGTYDKFIGDAVMAFWGAPVPQPDHARLACKAAVEMHRAFRAFTSAHASPQVRTLQARIGVNTGTAALGNMGSTRTWAYTAMGDTVNVASRLEGINKSYGTSILVSETSIATAADGSVREIDAVKVVGRATPLRVFELLDEATAPPQKARDAYAEGLTHYRAARFTDAEKCFRSAREAGDGRCSVVMAERSAVLAASPPVGSWDGVYQMGVK